MSAQRSSKRLRRPLLRPALFAALPALISSGCVVKIPAVLDAGDEAGDTGESGGDDEAGDPTVGGEDGVPADMATDEGGGPDPTEGGSCEHRALDILFVIDNSGSMGGLQRRLAESVHEVVLGISDAGYDYRLAFTTTDVGNPWCPPDTTTPEKGRFVLSSCASRLDDFVFGLGDGAVDMSEHTCLERCILDPAQLEIQPTTTEHDPEPAPRPWLEFIDGQSNLAMGTSVADAVDCLLPMGVNGCGFEEPLEGMRLALQRAASPGQPEYDFMRTDANLLIVLVSDEADCSAQHDTIFEQEGERAFWSDPSASFPTSAVCWNAGVSCSGDPNDLDCVSADKATAGGATMDPAAAALYPLDRYRDELDLIRLQKQSVDAQAKVAVVALTGVGLGGELHYADAGASDPEFQDSFGVGPGCTFDDNPFGVDGAVPPVRLREIAEETSTTPLHSICDTSYAQFLHDAIDATALQCD